MTVLKPFAALLLAAGLAACSSMDEDAAAGAGGAGAGAGGAYGAGAMDPTSVEYFRQQVGDRVFFATDSSQLDLEAQSTLRRQAQWLMENPARTATVEGHADERGTREYNLALGARRAAAARNFLVSEGVPQGRLRQLHRPLPALFLQVLAKLHRLRDHVFEGL